jgi:DTW domain-containing protein YfiP
LSLGPKSESLESVGKRISITDLARNPIRFVFIDSTWLQAQKILKNETLADLKQVKLENKKTMFWRYQTGQTDEHLATVEVINRDQHKA